MNSRTMRNNDLSIGDILISKKTKLQKYITKGGKSKNYQWLEVEGSPCMINDKNEDGVFLNSFISSSTTKVFFVCNKELDDYVKANIYNDEIIDLPKYPDSKLNLKEFENRKEYNNFLKKMKKSIKDCKNDTLSGIIKDKLISIILPQGSTKCINIDDYILYKDGKIDLKKHKRIGHPIFNRASNRWCPTIDIDYEDFEKSSSFPAPLGIRKKDYCSPSELIETLTELLKQISMFKNIGNVDKLLEMLDIDNKKCDFHKCQWCNKIIDINEYSSTYKSSSNYIEICHKDPNSRFIKSNVYWGHSECNRKQGNNSEEEFIKQALLLIKNNPKYNNMLKDLI